MDPTGNDLSPAAAAAALKNVESAERRSHALGFSALAGTQLVLWGGLWLVCDTAIQFGPPWAPVVWAPGVLIGSIGSVILSRSHGGSLDPRRALSFAVLIAFVNLIATGLRITAPADMTFLVSALVACAYIMTGIWRSGRLGVIGVFLLVVTAAGWWFARPWFALWMGVAGGGTLILTGLWMRRL